MTTLNDMIRNAITGAELEEEHASSDIAPTAGQVVRGPSPIADEAVKVASALRFISGRGVEAFLAKEAASLPEGTDINKKQRFHTQSQVGPHKGAPPMNPKGSAPDTNAKQRPGGGEQQAGSSRENGNHHPALASNEAAIGYDKKEKTKKVSPTLKGLLDATPFADGKLKENLTGAAGKGDKNIHKTAGDTMVTAEMIRRELELRASEAR